MEPPRPPEAPSELAEMLREAERVLDRQLEAIEREDRKSERILQLGSAALAGGLAVATFFAKGGPANADLVALFLFLAGGAQNIAGLLLLLDAYVSLRGRMDAHAGPDPDWLRTKAQNPTWNLTDHYASLLEAYPSFFAHNRGVMARATRQRGRGVVLVVGAVIGYALGLAYILGRATLG